MQIQIQCCGIVLMLVLFYFYIRQKRISLNTQKAFFRVFAATFFCITFDILSIGVIEGRHMLPAWLVNFVAKTYLVTLLSVALSALSYMCVDIYTTRELYLRKMRKFLILGGIATIGTYVVPIYYHYAEDGETILYTHGPSLYVTYGTALIFFAVILYLLKKEKAKINPRRREAVCLWLFVWIVASQIQFMYTNILIVGYAGSIGIMVLYLKLENPETNLDRITGLFNSSTLYQYTRQLFFKEQDFAALVILFENSAYQNVPLEKRESVKMEIIEYLLKLPDALSFKSTEDEFYVLFSDRETAEKNVHEIRRRFRLGWGENGSYPVQPYWLYLPHANVVEQAESLLYLIRYIRHDGQVSTENDFLLIGKDSVDKMEREKATEQLILEAMEEDRVEVFFQPIFSTTEQRITTAEALVRIRDREGKIIPPGVFIEIAEKTGMILRLGEIVFEKVCDFIRKHPLERYGLHYIEVNLSVVQCAYARLAQDYIHIMEKYGIDSKHINLEITESASISAKKTLLGNMENLMQYGVRFSLDDFGTGQSNLNYIVDMPVDIIKFDSSMTNAYFENGRAKYVMDAAIHMIHGMNLKIVSEGIETKEQYQTMRDLGISYIQGYYFSKPLPAEEFIAFLEAQSA
ncbi:MAG: EAL domain-containing protein [Candidatus Gastranaerophilales bacterium]|nr:EAL domain-containing protein [Candidatus Gastranaerophilales bacterium]